MKKVMIVGPPFFDYCKSIGAAFEQKKCIVTVIDDVTETQLTNIWQIVKYKFTRRKDRFFEKRFTSINKRLVFEYDTFKPDLVLVVRGALPLVSFLSHVKGNGSILAFWAIDAVKRTPLAHQNLKFFDKIFVFEKTDVDYLKGQQLSTHFLPMAADTSIYKPIPKTQKSIDVLFVGNLSKERLAILKQVIQRFPSLNIKIYGYYFSKYFEAWRYFFRTDKKYFTNTIVTPQQLNVLYNSAKICLNLHHSQSEYGVNPRFFEILASGSFMLCDSKPFANEFFSELNNCYFTTTEGLLQKIENELVIASNINVVQKIKQEHSFTARVETILMQIETK
jgi:spore maturation protein CgeB